MWVEALKIENVRSFDAQQFNFTRGKGEPYRWVTLLGENGGGKSTVLQALGLLLAGPEGAQTLVPRPVGWLRDEKKLGRLTVSLRQGSKDPGRFRGRKTSKPGYSLLVTGRHNLYIDKEVYTEPTFVGLPSPALKWLRENAFSSRRPGWFSAGYGAFRRLTRSNQVIVPALDPLARFTNFLTQFNEDEPLATFEKWMVFLDYVIAKDQGLNANKAFRQRSLGIAAINRILPSGTRFDRVTSEGRILFDMGGRRVPTIAMSDGYRSLLALTGDLIWRLIQSFPASKNPLEEEGVVLIDELDIHLHPRWQRYIAGVLRALFPRLQFFVATHSPFIAAGAGEDALTLRLTLTKGTTEVEVVDTPAALSVDRILESEAFGQLSPYSPPTQAAIDRYDELSGKKTRTQAEEKELQELRAFMQRARPVGGPPKPGSLDARMEAYIDKVLQREGRG